ncbi:MAG: hypothetical protein KBA61_08160 [Spirochaetes bacterium]|nr:hypothetical protein [Spirochaetota bacterium]
MKALRETCPSIESSNLSQLKLKRSYYQLKETLDSLIGKYPPWRVVHPGGPHYFKSKNIAAKFAKQTGGYIEQNEKCGYKPETFPELDSMIDGFCKKAVYQLKRKPKNGGKINVAKLQYIITNFEKQLDILAAQQLKFTD